MGSKRKPDDNLGRTVKAGDLASSTEKKYRRRKLVFVNEKCAWNGLANDYGRNLKQNVTEGCEGTQISRARSM